MNTILPSDDVFTKLFNNTEEFQGHILRPIFHTTHQLPAGLISQQNFGGCHDNGVM